MLYDGSSRLSLSLGTAPAVNASFFPEMCKWNAFTIDTQKHVCEHEPLNRENIFHIASAT